MELQLEPILKSVNGFLDSSFFSVIKFLIGIYVIVLFADIVLLFMERGIRADWRMTFAGANVPLDITASGHGIQRRWQKIESRLKSDNPAEYKIAIIEADKEVDQLLEKVTYKGANMTERLEQANESQIANLEALKKAHQFRNRVIKEKDLLASREEAEEIISVYRDYLENVQAL